MIPDDYIWQLAKKNGCNLFEMPTSLGKPFGALTKRDIEALKRDADRAIALVVRFERGSALSTDEEMYLEQRLAAQETLNSEALAWALKGDHGTQ